MTTIQGLSVYGGEHRMVFGATTFRQFVQMLAEATKESEARDRAVAITRQPVDEPRADGRRPGRPRAGDVLFSVISGQSGTDPIFGCAADFDLELLETRTLAGRTQELIYRPSLHA